MNKTEGIRAVFVFTLSIFLFFTTKPIPSLGKLYGERVITDVDIILSSRGVTLDYSYNQTSSVVNGELQSVPGCPKSIDEYPWVYFGKPPRCYLAGNQGPCQLGNLLYVEMGSPYGICSSACFMYDKSSVRESPDGRYKLCGVWGPSGNVYDKNTKASYKMGKRGPCCQGEWLVMDRSKSSVTCVPACPHGALYFPDSGDCIEGSFSRGSSGASFNSNECPPKQKFSSILKKCVNKRPVNSLLIG